MSTTLTTLATTRTIWAPITGFPGYEVSNTGLIRSMKGHEPRIMRQFTTPTGYQVINLQTSCGAKTSKRVHRLVAAAFLGNLTDQDVVRHLDNNKTNNHITNLAIGTQAENVADSVRAGTHGRRSSTTPFTLRPGETFRLVPHLSKPVLVTNTGRVAYRSRSGAWCDAVTSPLGGHDYVNLEARNRRSVNAVTREVWGGQAFKPRTILPRTPDTRPCQACLQYRDETEYATNPAGFPATVCDACRGTQQHPTVTAWTATINHGDTLKTALVQHLASLAVDAGADCLTLDHATTARFARKHNTSVTNLYALLDGMEEAGELHFIAPTVNGNLYDLTLPRNGK